MFNEKEIEYMLSLGIEIDYINNITEEHLDKIEDVVSLDLQKHGFNENYEPTYNGLICESILDKIY